MRSSRADLSRIGERRAIELIRGLLTKSDAAIGIGDDCAAVDVGDELLLITTDMINQRTHVPKATAWQIGWHLIAINLSDIASKGGRPIGVVTALGLPKGTTVQFLRGLVKGMDACAREFRTAIIGGDTKESRELNLTGTAFGLVKKADLMPRDGAKPGDLLAITGHLGGAAAGSFAIRRGKRNKRAIKALLEPWPRVREGMALARTHAVSSSIDVSDGLSTSLHHLADASGVGFMVDYARLPVSPELAKVGPIRSGAMADAVLHFGGEYELLITIRPGEVSLRKAINAVERSGTTLTVIGKVTKGGVVLQNGGKRAPLENKGWEHFRSRPSQ